MFMLLGVDVIVVSSAYAGFTGACGVGVSDVCMLSNVGDRTPCGTPVLNWCFVSECSVCFASFNLRMICGMFVWG